MFETEVVLADVEYGHTSVIHDAAMSDRRDVGGVLRCEHRSLHL